MSRISDAGDYTAADHERPGRLSIIAKRISAALARAGSVVWTWLVLLVFVGLPGLALVAWISESRWADDYRAREAKGKPYPFLARHNLTPDLAEPPDYWIVTGAEPL
jgi:hypothetical protein